MFTVVNPYTEEPFGEATVGTAADVEVAVRSAHRAGSEGPWPGMPLEDRIAVARRISEGLTARADELGRIATCSMGGVYSRSRLLGSAADLIDMYVEAVERIRFEYLRIDRFGSTLIRRRPVGVVAGIVPWNAPIRGEVKKVIPAILAGCTIVVKPAPETPFGAAILAEICTEAGAPPGVVNLVPGGPTTGEVLVTHPLVRNVAFTGSSAVGTRIATIAAQDFKRLQLEMGGKSAAIVLEDADLAATIPWLERGIFSGAGQACVATSRVVVARERYDEVVDAMATQARKQVLGDPFDPATTMGPLVAERQRTRVLGYIDKGNSEGAKLVTGGSTPAGQPRGWFVEPTVFANVDNSMTIAQEEIFGPVVSIIPFDDEDEAVRIANDSVYGLGGAVYSADAEHALAVAERVDSGYISVNQFGIASSGPFGGVKRSGVSREHGVEGYDSFLEYVSHPVPKDLADRLSQSIPVE
jgi:betaine-aldehyde dehydrogenase